uniref:Beta_elim_lyase domain-containing protein n=1 Tax=Rhabditophanes sp. KR3021 TaxID=114890 RepID=A0AC35TKT7_9BILA
MAPVIATQVTKTQPRVHNNKTTTNLLLTARPQLMMVSLRLNLFIVAKSKNLWIHADAAYLGGSFLLPEYQKYVIGMELLDSLIINMHTNADRRIHLTESHTLTYGNKRIYYIRLPINYPHITTDDIQYAFTVIFEVTEKYFNSKSIPFPWSLQK